MERATAIDTALGGVVRRLLDEADGLYRRADSGIAVLPRRCAPAMYAARLLYAEIGNEVARRGYDSVSQRAVVSPWRKLRVLAGLPALGMLPRSALDRPPLAATAYLVDAAAHGAATLDVRRARTGKITQATAYVSPDYYFSGTQIAKVGADSYRITMAVAGFSEEDLEIQVKEGVLSVSGGRKEAGEERRLRL